MTDFDTRLEKGLFPRAMDQLEQQLGNQALIAVREADDAHLPRLRRRLIFTGSPSVLIFGTPISFGAPGPLVAKIIVDADPLEEALAENARLKDQIADLNRVVKLLEQRIEDET